MPGRAWRDSGGVSTAFERALQLASTPRDARALASLRVIDPAQPSGSYRDSFASRTLHVSRRSYLACAAPRRSSATSALCCLARS